MIALQPMEFLCYEPYLIVEFQILKAYRDDDKISV
jgi:hypothetical protein